MRAERGQPTVLAHAAAPREVRSLRRLLLIAGGVYLAWWFLVEAILPGSFNPLPGRLAVVAFFFAAAGLSFVSDVVVRRLELVFTAAACVLTLHYYYLLHRNHGDMPWAIGAYVVVVAAGACLPSRRSLAFYSLVTVALGLAVSLVDRSLLRTIFLPGLVTMTLLTNVSLRSRILLEEERAERIRLDAARAAAEAGITVRDEFIAVASHELFTPLTSLQLTVQGFARVLRRGDGPPNVAALERFLDNAQRQLTGLTRLVDSLLDASRIASGGLTLHLEEVALAPLVNDVAARLSAEAARMSTAIEVTVDGDVSVRCDRARIQQAIANLVRNALAFGQGKPVHITLATEGPSARIAVADRGIGIARDQQARIFDRFERAVSADHYGGLGLGLYVVRQIALAHGGSVRLESEPGAGSTFIVEIPRPTA